MSKLVVLTGAGISAESGLQTFRDADGLWEGHDVKEVASPEGFQANPELVMDFYNQRRRQLKEAKPNLAHSLLSDLENQYEVKIITQNVDNLHERAGSSSVLHLHGQLNEVRPIDKVNQIITWEDDLILGDLDERGVQLRPNVVWFGEAVPAIDEAMRIVPTADLFLIIGTSLQVYPAAGLIEFAPDNCPIYIIDPNEVSYHSRRDIHHIKEVASKGMIEFIELIS